MIHIFEMGWNHKLVKSCVGGSDMSDGLLIKVCIPKDLFVCPKKGISATILWPGDGIETINPALGRGLDS